MKIKSCKTALITALSFSIVFLSACATQGRYDPQNTPERTRYQGQNITGGRGRTMDYGDNMRLGVNPGADRIGTTPQMGTNMGLNMNNAQSPAAPMADDRMKADNIRSKLEAMPGISKVNVIVMGNTAVVGCSRQAGTSSANSAEKMVADRVKQIDPSITNVYVTESADLGNRISRLYRDMVNNRPMNEIRDDFTKIINSITPTGTMGR